MPAISQQIGWNTESKLLQNILKQIERLTGVISASGGGATTLGALSDVSITAPLPGNILVFDGTKWVNVPSGGGGAPGGVTTNIQVNNGGAFAGSNLFTWDDANQRFTGGTSTAPSGTQTFTFGDGNINKGRFGSAMFGELSEIETNVGSGFNAGELNYIQTYGGHTMGRGVKSSGFYSWAGGWYSPGAASGKTNLKAPLVAGSASFGFFETDLSQTDGHGVLAGASAVLGGVNPNIPADSPRSVILGGNLMKARAASPDQVYVPNFNIVTAPLNDNALVQVLVRDSVTGQIKFRTAASLSSAPAGATGNIQFNNAGALGANANFFWNNTNGRLGINTGAPTLTLEVVSTVSPIASFRNTTGNTEVQIDTGAAGFAILKLRNNTVNKWDISNDGSNNNFRIFNYATVLNAVTITPTSLVGIGTAAPGARLDVISTGAVTGFHIGSPGADLIIGETGTGVSTLITNTNFIVRPASGGYIFKVDTANGNVGLGTSSPTTNLDVRFRTKSHVAIGQGTLVGNDLYAQMDWDETGKYFLISAVENGIAQRNIALNPFGGNVGIGTTNPALILHVAAAQNITFIQSTTTTNPAEVQITNTSGNLQVGVEGNTPGTRMGGTLGFAPYFGTSISTAVTFHTSNLNRMTISSNGAVGIGTATPISLFHIVAAGSLNAQIQATAVSSFSELLVRNVATVFQMGVEGVAGTRFPGTIADSPYIGSATAVTISFFTNNASRFRINPAGLVTIAGLTGSGTTTATLDSNGTFGRTAAFSFDVSDNLVFTDGKSIFTGLVTGTKFGGSNLQKLSFWGATPVVRPTNAIGAVAKVNVGGGVVQTSDTWSGYTIGKVVAALQQVGILT